MSDILQAYLMGVMTVLTPSLLALVWLLRSPERGPLDE